MLEMLYCYARMLTRMYKVNIHMYKFFIENEKKKRETWHPSLFWFKESEGLSRRLFNRSTNLIVIFASSNNEISARLKRAHEDDEDNNNRKREEISSFCFILADLFLMC
jgi:hypothetical protein